MTQLLASRDPGLAARRSYLETTISQWGGHSDADASTLLDQTK